MQPISSRIWTDLYIFRDDNHYTTGTFLFYMICDVV